LSRQSEQWEIIKGVRTRGTTRSFKKRSGRAKRTDKRTCGRGFAGRKGVGTRRKRSKKETALLLELIET